MNGTPNPFPKEVDVDALVKSILLASHPVGSYYWSSDKTDPGTIFGGTWEQIKDRFVLAAGSTYTVDETGGEATHKLTTEELASHSHKFTVMPYTYNDAGIEGNTSIGPDRYGAYVKAATYTTAKTGSGTAHNNMPPYIVAYCWKRTA